MSNFIDAKRDKHKGEVRVQEREIQSKRFYKYTLRRGKGDAHKEEIQVQEETHKIEEGYTE